MNSKEKWKDINNFVGLYQISNLGQVKSLSRNSPSRWGTRVLSEKILKPCLCSGYLRVMLSNNSHMKGFLVHRLLALHFIDNPNNYNIVNHIDGNILNNNLSNLEWVSQMENISHFHSKTKKSSKYIGVTWNSKNKKWISQISIKDKSIYIGSYNTELEAYNARKLHEKSNNINNKYS